MARARNNTHVILFNPLTCEKTLTTMWYVKQLLGINDISYNYRFRRKVKKINCYILEPNTPDFILTDLMESEKVDDEIWVDIENTNIQWQVSNYGRYRHRRTSKSPWKFVLIKLRGAKQLPYVTINIDGKVTWLHAKKMVAKYFLEGDYDSDYAIIQIDENKFNCCASNLVYVKRSEYKNIKGPKSLSMPVYKVYADKNIIADEYQSINEAARCNFVSASSIRSAIGGERQKLSCGYRWFRTSDIRCRKFKFEEEEYNE